MDTLNANVFSEDFPAGFLTCDFLAGLAAVCLRCGAFFVLCMRESERERVQVREKAKKSERERERK